MNKMKAHHHMMLVVEHKGSWVFGLEFDPSVVCGEVYFVVGVMKDKLSDQFMHLQQGKCQLGFQIQAW